MTDKELLEAAGLLYAGGVQLSIGGHCFVTPELAVRYLREPERVEAELAGLTVKQYRQWQEACTVGYIRCSARTKGGRQCLGRVVGWHDMNPASWLTKVGGYCHVHGG